MKWDPSSENIQHFSLLWDQVKGSLCSCSGREDKHFGYLGWKLGEVSLDLTFLTTIYSCELAACSKPFSLMLFSQHVCALHCALFAKKLDSWDLSTLYSLYHKYVEQQCPPFYHLSPKELYSCFQFPCSSVSHERCLSWSQLPSRFMIVSIVIMAPITQQKWPYGTSMSLQRNAHTFLLIIYCIVCQWPYSELCILSDQRSCHTQTQHHSP